MNQSSTNPAGQTTPLAVVSTDIKGATGQLNETPPGILVAIPDAGIGEVIRRVITEIGLKDAAVAPGLR